jgi:hypothetical protein
MSEFSSETNSISHKNNTYLRCIKAAQTNIVPQFGVADAHLSTQEKKNESWFDEKIQFNQRTCNRRR